MDNYGLLDPAEEDALHRTRLLRVEEKHFNSLTRHLLEPSNPTNAPLRLPPTPPPDADNADDSAAQDESRKQAAAADRKRWRQEILLDFSSFEASIIRMQFLLTTNAKERDRYAVEKGKILDAAQAVRINTAELRVLLEEAQRTLAKRKTWDELAEEITRDRTLKSREEQHAQLEKLNTEIAELEQESRDYAQTWAERRQQFERIVEEGRQMLRLIRDEKEEAERKEGMEDRDEESASRGANSGVGTPRPDVGDGTPLHGAHESDKPTPSKALPAQRERLLPVYADSPISSRAPSPGRQGTRQRFEGEDTEMVGSGAAAADSAATPSGETGDMEEGEEQEDGPERMDTA